MSEKSTPNNLIDELPSGVKGNLSPREEVVHYLRTFEIVERPNYIILTDRRLVYFNEKRLGRYDFVSLPFQKILQMKAERGVFFWGDISFKTEDGATILLEKVDRDRMVDFIDTLAIAYNKMAVEPISIKHTKDLIGQETWEFNKPEEIIFRQQPSDQSKPSEDPLNQLKIRFIKGEISEEEYRARLRVLQER
ncbi:PH domain-containing protein [Candidatus Bathyarchaeota archaeon]|nr:PH domain-containing protein [Candidatus Bathyarchaeota archaeon]